MRVEDISDVVADGHGVVGHALPSIATEAAPASATGAAQTGQYKRDDVLSRLESSGMTATYSPSRRIQILWALRRNCLKSEAAPDAPLDDLLVHDSSRAVPAAVLNVIDETADSKASSDFLKKVVVSIRAVFLSELTNIRKELIDSLSHYQELRLQRALVALNSLLINIVRIANESCAPIARRKDRSGLVYACLQHEDIAALSSWMSQELVPLWRVNTTKMTGTSITFNAMNFRHSQTGSLVRSVLSRLLHVLHSALPTVMEVLECVIASTLAGNLCANFATMFPSDGYDKPQSNVSSRGPTHPEAITTSQDQDPAALVGASSSSTSSVASIERDFLVPLFAIAKTHCRLESTRRILSCAIDAILNSVIAQLVLRSYRFETGGVCVLFYQLDDLRVWVQNAKRDVGVRDSHPFLLCLGAWNRCNLVIHKLETALASNPQDGEKESCWPRLNFFGFSHYKKSQVVPLHITDNPSVRGNDGSSAPLSSADSALLAAVEGLVSRPKRRGGRSAWSDQRATPAATKDSKVFMEASSPGAAGRGVASFVLDTQHL